MEIKYVPWAIANNFGTHIELNENLRSYPELHKALLEHELEHTQDKGFTKKDFLLDIGPSKVNYFKLFIFMCKYPKSFLQFAPIYKKGKELIYDINMIIAWTFFLAIVGLSVFLAIK